VALIKKTGDPIPVYYRLQTDIQQQIENGHWPPGERIPPERSLAETYKVSVGTAKKAILNLVHEGYLYRMQGKGTFVAGTSLRLESLRYHRLLRHFKDAEAALKVKLLNLRLVSGRQPHNRYLKLRANQDLYEMKRMFYLKEKPVIYCVSYLPQRLFAKLEMLPTRVFEKITLYETLEKNYGVQTIYNQELFGAVAADKTHAAYLKIEPGQALLFIEMLSYTYKDKPYEYRETYCLTSARSVYRET
jgi:GntR family transcriptional regulator